MDSQVLSMRITTHFDDQNRVSDDVLSETDGSAHPCFHNKTSMVILVPRIIYKAKNTCVNE